MKKWLITMALGWALTGQAEDRYKAVFEEGLRGVSVTACFDGPVPVRIYHSTEASRFTQGFRAGEQALKLGQNRGSTRLPKLPRGRCLNWRVDLERASGRDDSRLALRIEDDFVSDADLWFFRGAGTRKVIVDVKLPGGYSISTPWDELEPVDGMLRFRPASTPASWSSRIAVGRFDVMPLAVDSTEVRLAIIGSPGEPAVTKLRKWMFSAAKAVSEVYGRYPQQNPQVLVIPIGPRSEPVPWAHVTRGGGTGAEFFVDQTRPLEEFNSDWTACHELSHMLLPFISSRDRWLSEGLASYYQYVLLARSGVLTEQQAWQALYEGFERGRKDTSNEPLSEAALKGDWPTMRIYWSGAAMMMIADARLRVTTDGRQSLDTALASLRACCLPSNRRWRARELFERLDRSTGTTIFTDVYRQNVSSHSFPELNDLWQSMGLQVRRNKVRITEPAALSDVRKGIMQG